MPDLPPDARPGLPPEAGPGLPPDAGPECPTDAGPGLPTDARPGLRPLPPVRGAGLAHVVVPGTAVWFVAFVVLLFLIPTLRAHDEMLWLWTALAGWLLGFVGMGIYLWQRAAARRGSRGASSMSLQESFRSGGAESTEQ